MFQQAALLDKNPSLTQV